MVQRDNTYLSEEIEQNFIQAFGIRNILIFDRSYVRMRKNVKYLRQQQAHKRIFHPQYSHPFFYFLNYNRVLKRRKTTKGRGEFQNMNGEPNSHSLTFL